MMNNPEIIQEVKNTETKKNKWSLSKKIKYGICGAAFLLNAGLLAASHNETSESSEAYEIWTEYKTDHPIVDEVNQNTIIEDLPEKDQAVINKNNELYSKWIEELNDTVFYDSVRVPAILLLLAGSLPLLYEGELGRIRESRQTLNTQPPIK